mmetsp:Transcript_4270/g.10678  ORF Transcript_4270/g.10678 Transcript_4270/m.10678 type:complete len:598 (+) Transcript_4270:221-2014(+)
MSSSNPTTPSIDEDLFAPSQENPMEEEAAPAVVSQAVVATEYNTCIQEMNVVSSCMEASIDDCGCFYEGIVAFRQEFPREIRKQFYSAQAWLPSTDLYFCEVANQRVCRNYQTVQSCCCTEQTTAYKDCFINNVLIYELPIPSGCYSTCESTVELRPDVAGGPTVVEEINYDNDTNQNSTIITAVLASVLGVFVVVGTILFIRYCQRKKRKNKIKNKNGVVDATKSPTLDSSSQEGSSSTKKNIKAAEEGMCIHDDNIVSFDDDKEDGSESSDSSDNSTIQTKEMTHPRSFGDMMSLASKTPAVDVTPSIYQAKERKKHHIKSSSYAISPSRPGKIEEEQGGGTGSQSRTASYNVHELIGSSGGKVYPTAGDIHNPANRSIEDVKKDRDGTKEILYRLKTTQAELQRLMEKSTAEAMELPEDDPMSEWSRNEIMKELHEIKTKMMHLQDANEFYENQLASFKTELKLLRIENSNTQLKESLKSMEDRYNNDDDKSDPSLFSSTSRSSPSRSNKDDSNKDSLNKTKLKSKSKSKSSSQIKIQKPHKGHNNSSKRKLSSSRTGNSGKSSVSSSNNRRSSYKKSASSSRIDLAGNISMVQ